MAPPSLPFLGIGQLRTFRRALPTVAEIGGMVLPAPIYPSFNRQGHARPQRRSMARAMLWMRMKEGVP
jgi:Na+/H+ antiporter NhaA